MKLTINIDGGSRGNPGPAAYGCYIQGAGKGPISLKGRLGNATNNVAEYHGLIRALEKSIELQAGEVQILADSELLVRQMTGVYKVKNEKMIVLHQLASKLVRQLGKVTFKHVYREQNSIADALCNEALDDPTLSNEQLGLLPSTQVTQTVTVQSEIKPLSNTPKEKHAKQAEYAKIKLSGSLLTLTSLKRTVEYAVVVNGASWRISQARVPSDIKPGDHVVVLGYLEQTKSFPVVRVKSIRKA